MSWPDQPIEFRYDGGKPAANTAKMMGPLGSEVPFQWATSCSDTAAVLGCIVVRSNLPANANYTWTLTTATPSASPTNPVAMATVGNNLEITNGLTGIRIVTAAANGTPWNKAPIQGILMSSGTWTGAESSPNLLYSESSGNAGVLGASLTTPMYTATAYTVMVDPGSGPLKTVVTVNYTFNRPQYYYPPSTIINTAGTGHLTMIVTVYANSKSVLIDEDTDMQMSYYLPVYSQLAPDTARWRGHDSFDSGGVLDPNCGYETPLTVTGATAATPGVITTSTSRSLSNGQPVVIAGVLNLAATTIYYAKSSGFGADQFGVYSDSNLTMPVTIIGSYSSGGIVKPAYRGQTVSPETDAFQDLLYAANRPAGNACNIGTYRKMLVADAAEASAAGWYVEMYNSGGGPSDPVVGFYVGRGSKQLYSAIGPSMPGLYTSNNHFVSRTTDGGIQIDNLLLASDGSTPCGNRTVLPFTPCEAVIHRNWGIFTSTQADLLSPSSHQPIADEQNGLTGINLSRLYTYQLVYPDPMGGWQWLYLTNTGAAQLISWVQDGTSVCGSTNCYSTLLNNSEGSLTGLALVAMWKGNSTAAVQTALNSATGLASSLGFKLASGDNHFDNALGYYQLGLSSSPAMVLLNAILMNGNTTLAQKNSAKAAAALFGCVFWDDDWFPIDQATGESLGLANQVQQYLQYRAQSVFSAPSQPFLSQQLATAVGYSTSDLAAYFSSTGAAAGSTHYQSTFFEPLILNYINPATQGYLSMTDPKWAAYANWELSIQTPPEPRFGNIRKVYSNGDGNTEADPRTGMLGTALYPVNSALAGNLMWAWLQSNTATRLTEDSQFVSTLAVIDPTTPSVTPQLASINIPGYHSVERFNFGTPNETALWFINGDFYQSGGHRHEDDGQVSIYAHSAPLAIDWNANLYNPQTPGRWMHNSIVFNSELSPTLWTSDNTALTLVGSLFNSATNTEFESFSGSTHSAATFAWPSDGTIWTRSVRTMNFNSAYPIIYVKDTFSGASATASKTITWNMMATGAVSTPAGSITPTTRFSSGCQSPAGQLPSTSSPNSLAAGLNKFNFTGVSWPAHATGGINWDLWTYSAGSSQQFLLGNWGHGCQSTREEGEFQTANGVPFAETQHILRVNDTGSFTTVIGPYNKGATPTRTVTTQSCGTQIVQGSETTCFNDDAATWTNGTTSILTAYDSVSATAFGTTVAGGSQEATLTSGTVTWVLSGAVSGIRQLTLTGTWMTTYPGVTLSMGTFSYNFTGGLQAAPVTITFTP